MTLELDEIEMNYLLEAVQCLLERATESSDLDDEERAQYVAVLGPLEEAILEALDGPDPFDGDGTCRS